MIRFANFEIKKSYFIVFLCFGFIAVDMLNGVLIRNGYPSVSLPYKVIVISLIAFFLLSRGKYIVFVYALLAFFSYFSYFSYLDYTENMGSALLALARFLSIMIFYSFFLILVKNREEAYLFSIARISFWILVVNITLGALGFGYAMYANEGSAIGTRGLIFAGNELGAAIVVSGAVIMMAALEKKQYAYFSLIGMVMLIMSGFMTSKVSMFGSLLLFLCFPILKVVKDIKNYKIPKADFYYVNMIVLFVPLLSAGAIFYALYESNLIDRLSYFYQKLDLISIIFSNRNIWAAEAYDAFVNDYSFFQWFFGTGSNWWSFISENKIIEIDPFDFLMSYGIVGLIGTFGIIVGIIIDSIVNRKQNTYFHYIAFTIFLLLGMSTTAGHVFNSGTAGFLIAIVLAFGSFRTKADVA